VRLICVTATALVGALVALAPQVRAQQQAQIQLRGVRVQGADPVVLAEPVQIADPAQQANRQEVIRTALRNQFEPLLKAELSFANRACQWTAEERTRAIAAGKICLGAFLDAHAQQNGQLLNRQIFIAAGDAPVAAVDPSGRFYETLTDVLHMQMSDEQRERYDAERAARAAFRAEASIENIVLLIDQRLDLSPDQRDKIAAALKANWKPEWAPPMQFLIQMGNFIPAVPPEHVVPFLTNEQVRTWRGVQKVSARGNLLGHGLFGGGEQPINDIDLNEAP
jgi:hypothetical protein